MSGLQHTLSMLSVIIGILTFHRDTGAMGRKLFTKKKCIRFLTLIRKVLSMPFLGVLSQISVFSAFIHFSFKYYDNTWCSLHLFWRLYSINSWTCTLHYRELGGQLFSLKIDNEMIKPTWTLLLHWKLCPYSFSTEREIMSLLAQMNTVLHFYKLMLYNHLPSTYNNLIHFSKNDPFKNLGYVLDFAPLSRLKHSVCTTFSSSPFEKDGKEFCLMCVYYWVAAKINTVNTNTVHFTSFQLQHRLSIKTNVVRTWN